jgi:gas vesicle protein
MEDTTTPEGNYFLLGALVGAAVGTAIALLFAPQPGEELRGSLKEKGIELQRRAREDVPQAGDVRRRAESALQSARTEVESAAEEVASAAEETISSAAEDVVDGDQTL